MGDRELDSNGESWRLEELVVVLWAYNRAGSRPHELYEIAEEAAQTLNRSSGEVFLRLRQLAHCYPKSRASGLLVPQAEGSFELSARLDAYLNESPQTLQMIQHIVDSYRGRRRDPSLYENRRELLKNLASKYALSLTQPGQITTTSGRAASLPGGDFPGHGGFTQVTDQLRRWHRFPKQVSELWSSRPFDPQSLAALAQEARALQLRVSALKATPPPDPQAFEKARSAWEAAGRDAGQLDKASIKLLCQHPSTALDPEWISSLLKADKLPMRRTWFEGLISAYLSRWRSMEDPDAVEKSLLELVDKIAATQRWGGTLKEETLPVIGPDAPEKLLSTVSAPLTDWEVLIERWCLSRTEGLGPVILEKAIRRWYKTWVQLNAPQKGAQRLTELRAALRTLTRESGIRQACFQATITDLILSGLASQHIEIREELIFFVLKHPRLGDPRIKGHLWAGMGPAKARLISWMAQKDLRLFYDYVVSNDRDDQGRKAFWVNYLEHVVDFRLVLSQDDKERLEDRLDEHGVSFAEMEGSNQVSAFILRFPSRIDQTDLVCVEFSKSGNSLYIYDSDVFEHEVARMDARYFRAVHGPRNLKNMNEAKARIRHTSGWQSNASGYLNSHGIRSS